MKKTPSKNGGVTKCVAWFSRHGGPPLLCHLAPTSRRQKTQGFHRSSLHSLRLSTAQRDGIQPTLYIYTSVPCQNSFLSTGKALKFAVCLCFCPRPSTPSRAAATGKLQLACCTCVELRSAVAEYDNRQDVWHS